MRTVIIGNSGSGKSWLAKRISQKSPSQVIHLDEIFWLPGGFNEKRPPSEVLTLINTKKADAEWIVEGVYSDLAEQLLPYATLLIWLDLPWAVCKQRLEARGSESKAHMGREQSESSLRALIQWAEAYYSRSGTCCHAAHLALFETFAGQGHRFSTESQVHNFLNSA